MWWDYSSQDFQGQEAWRAFDLMSMVREAQPKIIMNNRLFRNREAGWASMGTAGYLPQIDPKFGDFITPEQHIPDTGMPGVDWETCMTMNTTWGYNEHDHAWKSDEVLVRNLIDIASKGGNYLLNIGPKGDGSVPAESIAALSTIGKWMGVYGESIYGTSASPFEKLAWGRCTSKQLPEGRTLLYLHVFSWPSDRKLQLPAMGKAPEQAVLLGANRNLMFKTVNDHIELELPEAPPNKLASVVALTVKSAAR
jgi:alpha-L-fucosidase